MQETKIKRSALSYILPSILGMHYYKNDYTSPRLYCKSFTTLTSKLATYCYRDDNSRLWAAEFYGLEIKGHVQEAATLT